VATPRRAFVTALTDTVFDTPTIALWTAAFPAARGNNATRPLITTAALPADVALGTLAPPGKSHRPVGTALILTS
jgi:hypothetical protein